MGSAGKSKSGVGELCRRTTGVWTVYGSPVAPSEPACECPPCLGGGGRDACWFGDLEPVEVPRPGAPIVAAPPMLTPVASVAPVASNDDEDLLDALIAAGLVT